MLGREGEELGDDVELGAADRVAHRAGIADVGDELAHAVWKRPARGAAVEDGHLVARARSIAARTPR